MGGDRAVHANQGQKSDQASNRPPRTVSQEARRACRATIRVAQTKQHTPRVPRLARGRKRHGLGEAHPPPRGEAQRHPPGGPVAAKPTRTAPFGPRPSGGAIGGGRRRRAAAAAAAAADAAADAARRGAHGVQYHPLSMRGTNVPPLSARCPIACSIGGTAPLRGGSPHSAGNPSHMYRYSG